MSFSPRPVPALARYCERVRACVHEGPVTRESIEALRALATDFVSEPLVLDARRGAVPAAGYARHLLHRDPEAGFVVIAMIWPPAIEGLPHDHGTWGVVVVASGEVEITDYRAGKLDPGGERVHLRPRARVVGRAGSTAFVLPPDEDVHQVRNSSKDEPAITVHTYGRDITRCRVIDPANGQVSWIEPKYDTWP